MMWRRAAFVGVLIGAVFAMASTFGATASGASTGKPTVVGGCTIRTDTLTPNRPCNLQDARLAKADLRGARLTGANLAGANLAGADLTGANLAGANLAGANLAGANLEGADLAGANLAKADLAGALVRDVSLDNVTWDNTICPDFSDSTGDGGSCNGAPAAAAAASPAAVTVQAPGSTTSVPYGVGQSTNLDNSAVGGAGVLAFTGFPTAVVALVGGVLVVTGLLLLLLPAPRKRKAASGAGNAPASGS